MSLENDPNSQAARDANELARLYRGKERVLALLLGFLGVGASIVYVVAGQKMGWLLLSVMISSEFMVLAAVYIVIVKRWRRGRRR
jgi:uncharacterized membrane protein YagU involved in acid resistance